MEHPKNRGKRHVLNKSKYNKNKPKQTNPLPKSKSLQSNWDRYGEELVDEYVPLGCDFSILANAPLSKGNHFQFKAEVHKKEFIEKTPLNTGGLFNIDLNLVGMSLSTVPFNERCGIPVDYFSDAQHKIMIKTAKTNEKMYDQSLSNEGIKINFSMNSYFSLQESIDPMSVFKNEKSRKVLVGSNPKYVKTKYENDNKPTVSEDKNLKTSTLDSKIEEISVSDKSNYSKQKQDPAFESTSSILETESLQQWLDDVLGD